MRCSSCQAAITDDAQRFCPSCGASLVSGGPTSGESRSEQLRIGQALGGKYRVVRLLGEGGMGEVYEGEQLLGTTKRKVAIKTLHAHLSRDPSIRARFEREVGTVAQLEHPNTIQVFDCGSTDDGVLYIVMEFLHGSSLAAALERGGPMAPERAARIVQQVCGSLEEAHARGIVHRDLKPDNVVLVERAGNKEFVKVLDFGIAKRAAEEDGSQQQKLTQQGMVLGTPPYMSPEQFSGRPVDARSDIYSLGVMAYEMLTGRLPYQANTAWEWATQHMTQPPIPIESSPEGSKVPAAMREAVARALTKSPDGRFQTVGDFGAAFSAASARGAADRFTAAGAPDVVPAQTATDFERQRTEVGAPLDLAAAFGATAPSTAAHTAAAGNVSFPTPGATPQALEAIEHGAPRRRSRAAILTMAGVIAMVSAGAITFSVRRAARAPSANTVQNDETNIPETTLTSAAPATPSGVPAAGDSAGGSDVPPLSVGGSNTSPGTARPSPHPNAHALAPALSKASAGTSASTASAPPLPATPPTSAISASLGALTAPTAAPAPPAPPTLPTRGRYDERDQRYEVPECIRARRLRAVGRLREAESWSLACQARGGIP